MLGGGDRPVDPRIALSLPSDHSIYEVRKSFLTIVTLTLLVTPVSPVTQVYRTHMGFVICAGATSGARKAHDMEQRASESSNSFILIAVTLTLPYREAAE